MHSTDLGVLTNLAPVAKSLMEKAGFKVDMQSRDWQTLVARRAKKDPPTAGGWNAILTSWVSADMLNPGDGRASSTRAATRRSSAGRATREMEKLRDEFARETDPAKQKAIAVAAQKRNTEYPTHVFLGQWYQPATAHRNIDGILDRARPGLLERREEEPVLKVDCVQVRPAQPGAGHQAGLRRMTGAKEESWLSAH